MDTHVSDCMSPRDIQTPEWARQVLKVRVMDGRSVEGNSLRWAVWRGGPPLTCQAQGLSSPSVANQTPVWDATLLILPVSMLLIYNPASAEPHLRNPTISNFHAPVTQGPRPWCGHLLCKTIADSLRAWLGACQALTACMGSKFLFIKIIYGPRGLRIP